MDIWNGTSVTRPDPLVRKKPDGEDWKTIIEELQATQKFITSLAVNMDTMPNLLEDIKAYQKQLQSMQVAINQLTVPEDIKIQVIELSAEMKKLHSVYSHASEVLQTVNLLQRQLLNLGRHIDNHVEETNQKHISFENRVANWQRANEERWNDRLQKAEEQLGAISLALGLKKFGES